MTLKDGCPIDKKALSERAIKEGRPPIAEKYVCRKSYHGEILMIASIVAFMIALYFIYTTPYVFNLIKAVGGF